MKKLIVANWKCNPTSQKEAQRMLLALKAGIKNNSRAEMVICPPFVYLPEANRILKNTSSIKLGAQNCFWEEKGTFTGEVSPKMLKDLKVKYVILGHSERKIIMNETNEMTAQKVKAVLNLNLTPVICIGETLEERTQSKTFSVIEKEFKESLQKTNPKQISKVIIAYEPLWAISPSDKICSSDDALTVALFIKKLAKEIYGKKTSEAIRVLYGGSVNAKNARDYLENDAISGLLVGGASLNIKEFLGILRNV